MNPLLTSSLTKIAPISLPATPAPSSTVEHLIPADVKTHAIAPGTIEKIPTSPETNPVIHAKPERASVPGRRSLTLPTAKGEVIISIREKSMATIPSDANTKLDGWLTKNGNELSEKEVKGERVAYDKSQIPAALKEFEEKYHCSWHEMKHLCTDKQTMQIINDLRSVYLEETFTTLRSEFPHLKSIADFGSSKLTSDRDFAFAVGAGHQTKESIIVARFNQLFEETWKAPSATVFDSNAYTMQYVVSAADPKMEERRSNLQNHGSMLMKMRNATPEDWKAFKTGTLSQISDPKVRESKAAEFEKVEKQNQELRLLLDKEILKIASKNPSSTTPLPDTRLLSDSAIHSAAETLKALDPHIEIQASNALHEKIKTSYHNLERQRVDIFSTLEKLDQHSHAGNADEFAIAFNAKTNNLIIQLKMSLANETDTTTRANLSSFIKQLENSRIEKGEAEPTMQAFKERTDLDKEEKTLQKERRDLEKFATRYEQVSSQLEQLKSQATKGSFSPTELKNMQLQMDKHNAELHSIKDHLKLGTGEDLGKALTSQITLVDKKLHGDPSSGIKGLAAQREDLALKHGEFWDRAGRLGLEGDRILIDMQRSNVLGMCFAQEAHVSEGAFAFVVLNLQAGMSDVRTLNQYGQAFREIGGFYSGHQVHQSTAHAKVTEASKYADRLLVTSKVINDRAKALGLTPPPLGEKAAELESFFKKVSVLRGTGKTDEALQASVEAAAKSSKLIGPEEPFNQKVLDRINGQMESMAANLESWLSQLPEKQLNAYYKT